jgi:hypothetical protein
MTTKHIFATAAITALALPAAASADRPTDKPAKPPKPAKTKSVGFAVGGVDLSGLTVTDGKLAGPLTLDPTSANKHARTFLKLSKADVKSEKTVELGTAADAVLVKFHGLTATDALKPTDRVKVIGKISGETLNIRKITVSRKSETEKPKTETAKSESTSTRKSPAEQCKGKAKKKAAGEKKSAYAKCVSAAAKAQNDDKPQS